jgi:hypothetical protein
MGGGGDVRRIKAKLIMKSMFQYRVTGSFPQHIPQLKFAASSRCCASSANASMALSSPSESELHSIPLDNVQNRLIRIQSREGTLTV